MRSEKPSSKEYPDLSLFQPTSDNRKRRHCLRLKQVMIFFASQVVNAPSWRYNRAKSLFNYVIYFIRNARL